MVWSFVVLTGQFCPIHTFQQENEFPKQVFVWGFCNLLGQTLADQELQSVFSDFDGSSDLAFIGSIFRPILEPLIDPTYEPFPFYRFYRLYMHTEPQYAIPSGNCYVAIEHGLLIMSFPIHSMVIVHNYVAVYQKVMRTGWWFETCFSTY